MASADVVSPAGPGGCPVVHGFDPMDPGQIDDPGPLTAIARQRGTASSSRPRSAATS